MRVQAKFWLEGVGISVLGTFGLLGNSMSVIVLNTYTSNRSFNNLLISLSIVDNLLIIFTLVEKAIIGCFLTHQPVWFINCYPHLWHPVKGMIHTAAIYMVVAVSAERFRAMCFPLRKRVAFYKFVGFVISLSVTVEIPRFFQFHLIDQDYWTTPLMENPDYVRISSIWDELLISGLIPLLALTYFNGRIYCKIRSSGKFEYRFVGSSGATTKKNSVFESDKSGKSRNSRSKEGDDKQSGGVSEPPLLQYNPTSENNVSLALNLMFLLKMSRRHVFDFQDAFEMRPMKRYKNGRRLSEGLVKWRRYEDGNDNWTDVPKIMVSFGAKIQIS